MGEQDKLRVEIFEQIDDLQATTRRLEHQATDEGSTAQSVISDDLNEIRHAVSTTEDAAKPTPVTKEIEDRG